MDNKNTNYRPIIGALTGALVFLLFLIPLSVNVFVSLAVGLACGFASMLIAKAFKSEVELVGTNGVSDVYLQETLLEGRAMLASFKSLCDKLPEGLSRKRALAIADLTQKILEDVKKDPKDAKIARKFLNYYLDTASKILSYYLDISVHKHASAEIKSVLAKTEATLEILEKAFANQLGRLLEDNVLDLDTELTVLQKTMQMEGLSDFYTPEQKNIPLEK